MYYFRVCGTDKHNGQGPTAYEAMCNGIGIARANKIKDGKRIDQDFYRNQGTLCLPHEDGVSNVKSLNGITIFSVTRLA